MESDKAEKPPAETPVPTRNSILGGGVSDGVFQIATAQPQNFKCDARHRHE